MPTVRIGTIIFDGAVPRDDTDRAYELLALCENNGMSAKEAAAHEREIESNDDSTSEDLFQWQSEMVDTLIDRLNILLAPHGMYVGWHEFESGTLVVSDL